MRLKIMIVSGVFALLSFLCVAADSPHSNSASTTVAQSSAQADAMRLEGEKRFRANCGRCHAAPQKFPPRVMATIVRHMRVRATITDEDMRLVLYYMTQ
ncbi:MAG TPA: cytochrome c [Terriglobales bacterium]|nr:cytochrome c [Terriglobales bacterium]